MLVTPSLTYVLFGSLREGVSVTDKASQLPGYLSDTFLHLDFGYAPKFHKPRGQVLLDTMPVDIALLIGSLVCGVAIGLAAVLYLAYRWVSSHPEQLRSYEERPSAWVVSV